MKRLLCWFWIHDYRDHYTATDLRSVYHIDKCIRCSKEKESSYPFVPPTS